MSDHGYGGPPPWDEPVGDPEYRPEPYPAAPPYGWPPHHPAGDAPPSYPAGDPAPAQGARTLLLVIVAIVVVAALGVGGFLALSDDGGQNPAAAGGPSLTGGGSLPVAPVPVPTISLPSIALPTFPSFPAGGPSGAAVVNPCTLASSVMQAAVIYVGLAEIGQSSTAQACVYRDAVPESVTAGLATSGGGGGGLYVPGRTSGSVVTFTTADGTGQLEVTVTREPDRKLYVTRVHTS